MTDLKLEDKSEEQVTVAGRWRQAAKHKWSALSVENHEHMHALRVTDVPTHRESKQNF